MSTSSTNIEYPSSATDTAITTRAMYGTNGASRPRGSVAPSRTAAMGGTRVARRAGKSPASTVITIPTSRLTTTVRIEKTRLEVGSPPPRASNNALSPFASNTPSARPTSEATTPITSASKRTETRTWRRDAPSVRSVASSRVRCATVIDIVLKITKAPTNSAIAANESRKYLMIFTNWLTSPLSSSACSVPLRTVTSVETSSSIRSTSVAGFTPSAAAAWIASNESLRSKRRCAVGMSKTANVAVPSDSTSPYRASPTTLKASTGPSDATLTVSPMP